MNSLQTKTFNVRESSWDTEVFGIKSGAIELPPLIVDQSGDVVRAGITEARAQGLVFVTIKVPLEATGLTGEFLRAGAELIVTEVDYEKKRLPSPPSATSCPDLRIIKSENFWDEGIRQLADEFNLSRFFMDKHIDKASASRAWQESLYNSCTGRATYSLIGFVGDKVAGVMNVFERAGNSDIFLICVHPQHRGKGFGRQLMLNYEGSLGGQIAIQSVSTQLNNYAAQNLYCAMGYRPARARHILHMWLK